MPSPVAFSTTRPLTVAVATGGGSTFATDGEGVSGGVVGAGGGQPDRCGQRLAPLHEDLGRWVSATAMKRGRATRQGADPGTSGRTVTRCTVERRGAGSPAAGSRTPSRDGHPGSSWTEHERL